VTRAESVTWGKPRRIAEAARPVRLTLFPIDDSALTTLANLQLRGYALIPD